jgi:hypothetical protein
VCALLVETGSRVTSKECRLPLGMGGNGIRHRQVYGIETARVDDPKRDFGIDGPSDSSPEDKLVS